MRHGVRTPVHVALDQLSRGVVMFVRQSPCWPKPSVYGSLADLMYANNAYTEIH